MVRETNFMREYVKPIGGSTDIPWTIVSGREIFESPSITSLNKIPVKVLGSFIQGGATLEGDVLFSLPELVENLLVDGTIATHRLETGLIFLENVVLASKVKIIQELPNFNRDGKKVFRIFILKGDSWDWEDVINYRENDQATIDRSKNGISADNLKVFPNGRGILYDAQFTYRRLEEIERRVRKASNSAVSMIIKGYVGIMSQLLEAINANTVKETGALVLPSGTSVDMPKTTAVVDQLHKDFMILLPGYFKMTNLIEFSDSSSMSGKSRKLLMQQTLEFTALTRKLVTEIYEAFGVKATFESIPTMDAEEKMKELSFLQALRDDKVINVTEYKRRAALLS